MDRCCFPPYRPRKALDKKSFSCHDAAVYIFGWNKAKKGVCKVSSLNSDQHDLNTILHKADKEYSFEESHAQSTVFKVTSDLIQKVRSRILNHSGFERKTTNKKERRYLRRNSFQVKC